MNIKRILLVCLLALPAQAADLPSASANTFEGCGWYVIMSCGKSYSAAKRIAGNGVLVVNTNDYPNFRNGWYCVADGPFNKRMAQNQRNFWQGKFKDAYIKKGC